MTLQQETPGIRVSTLELFFDLVFVFTVMQLSETLADDLTPHGLLSVLLILAVLWWMYSGYAWLTNAVGPITTTRRTLLLAGMSGFLVMAIAIPETFGEYGWIFGIAYVVVTIVHSVLFLRAGPHAVRMLRLLAPMNLLAALLVLAGGLLPEPYRLACWIAAPLVQIAAGYAHPLEMHSLAGGHFVERHSLVMIIAIGESIIAIGLGFREVPLDGGAILVAVLGLCIAYYLWWCYFAGDDRRSERVLAGCVDPRRRGRLALNAWGWGHVPMLLGIVVTAVGIKKTVGYAFEPMHWGTALALSGGVAIYLVGHAVYLRMLGLPGIGYRLVVAASVLAVIPLGHWVAVAQLAAIPIIMSAGAIAEDLPRVRRLGMVAAIGDFGRTESVPD
ncbi:low temperature requirement protein LtrA [Actinoplanes lutulentus]|uniref:Low temperature requirement protein LtrA n=1 Tax=Actinoplanes lutulentus TaxID=1287878 RepID=A0A327ZER6_9ACTN|nr:low temperature requirement protein A [Actinoplanes lutulentus]MBB2941792.1 low temperature requirement protein LtrA [Actinoplanes lutulentus]RAK39712.1 low temperature requirement protein LtrA [Actinoplanes lutulentus]